MKQALRCGVSVAEFWELTPPETYLAIEAAIWRDDRRQKQEITLAWRIANLMRAKKLPSLKSLVTSGSANATHAKPLRGEERVRRRKEFEEMSAAVDLEKLSKQMAAQTQRLKSAKKKVEQD